MTGSRESITRHAPLAVTVLTVVVGLQCLRVLFPVAYRYREGHGIPATALVAAIVFLTPALTPLLTRIVRPPVLVPAVVGLAVAGRLWIQVLRPVGIGPAAAATAVALLAVTVTVAPTADGRIPTLLVLAGLALDTAVRAAFGTWDLAWQDGAPARVATAIILVVLVAALVVGARAPTPDAPARDRTTLGLALGPVLALEILFLQSIAAVAGSADLRLAAATAVLLLADGLAALTVVATTARVPSRIAAAAAAVAGGVAVALLPGATGAGFVVLTVAGQVLVTVLLARAATGGIDALHTGRATATAAVGGALLGSTLFLYQLHYDRPLPIDNRWLLVGATLVLGLAAVVARPQPAAAPASRRTLARATVAVATAAVVVVAAVAWGAADPRPVVAGTSVRVATVNLHNGVNRDGQVDLEAVARHIEAVDADVVMLEEVDRGWLLAGTADVAEWLSRRLDMAYAWAPAADGQMGNVILHRVPIHDTRTVKLPRGTGTMDRSALLTRVTTASGDDLTVVGVHFQDGSTPDRLDTRIRETDVLLDAWGGAPRTVVLGDLNMDPGERDLRHLLAAGFSSTQPTDRCTLKTSNDNCVDWILVSGDLRQSRPDVVRVSDFDHNPVASTVAPR